MSWRASPGTDTCNTCHRGIDLGAPMWVGDLTPARWCETCASQFTDGLPPSDLPAHAFDKRAVAQAFPEFTAAMRALKAAASKRQTVERNWTGED